MNSKFQNWCQLYNPYLQELTNMCLHMFRKKFNLIHDEDIYSTFDQKLRSIIFTKSSQRLSKYIEYVSMSPVPMYNLMNLKSYETGSLNHIIDVSELSIDMLMAIRDYTHNAVLPIGERLKGSDLCDLMYSLNEYIAPVVEVKSDESDQELSNDETGPPELISDESNEY